MAELEPEPFAVDSAGVRLAGETIGEGPDVVLAHGLTATRRHVVMGSKVLPRAGYRLTTYDARGHGESSPATAPGHYRYRDLVSDMEAVLDRLGVERAVVGGASMGAATAVALALARPQRVAGLVLITPAFEGADGASLAEWDALAEGLARGGVEGFLAAYDPPVAAPFRETVTTVARQRLERHRHPEAVADALRVVPRSSAFEELDELRLIDAPALVVASRDEADPGHPLRVGERYAELLAHARLVVEDEGQSPLAWQGARVSHAIADFLDETQS